MKQIYSFITILAFFSCIVPATAQWTRLTNTYQTELLLNDIAVNGKKMTAVGYRYDNLQNYIFQSVDSGAHWDTTQPIYAGYIFLTVAFKDIDTGFIGGYSNKTIMMQTVNGGSTWDTYLYDTTNSGISDMVFIDSKRGFAGGYGATQFTTGRMYYTDDGGMNWVDQNVSSPSPLDSLGFEYINFLDVQTGYGLSDFGYHKSIIKTTDTGKHWTLAYTHSTTINGFYFWNVNNGILVDVLGHIYKTQNGGATWTQKTSPVTTQLISVSFADNNIGYIVGNGGVILKTTDGGETWTRETSPTTENLFRVKFFKGIAYATGNGGTVLRSAYALKTATLPLYYQVNVYPNPSASVLNVSASLNSHFKLLTAQLKDMNGKVLRSGQTDKALIQMNIGNLPSGIYIMSINADGQEYSEHISILH